MTLYADIIISMIYTEQRYPRESPIIQKRYLSWSHIVISSETPKPSEIVSTVTKKLRSNEQK